MAEAAIEELALFKLAARLAQAGDDRDAAAYRACLADMVWSGPPGEPVSVPADLYVEHAIARLSRTDWTHHRLANPVIDLCAGGARAGASIDVVVELSRTDAAGAQRRSTIGGRYWLGFVRDDGVWRIDRRALQRRYWRGDPLDPPC